MDVIGVNAGSPPLILLVSARRSNIHRRLQGGGFTEKDNCGVCPVATL